jgi:hypothetical protein
MSSRYEVSDKVFLLTEGNAWVTRRFEIPQSAVRGIRDLHRAIVGYMEVGCEGADTLPHCSSSRHYSVFPRRPTGILLSSLLKITKSASDKAGFHSGLSSRRTLNQSTPRHFRA